MLRRVLAPTAATTAALIRTAAPTRSVRGAHTGADCRTERPQRPKSVHPGMGDKDAWRGPLTGTPLTDVFTKDTLTWSSSLCFGDGSKDGAPPAVVDATTKERLPDLPALLARRTPAGFGRSDAPEATFHDDAVRRTSVVSGVEVEWPGLAAAVEKVRATLYPGEGPLTATLHNVLAYEEGDHFEWHRDMPKVHGHLATLSVECDVAGAKPATGPDAAAVVFAEEEGWSTAGCRAYAPRGAGDWAAWPIATRHRSVPVPTGANRVTAIFHIVRMVSLGESLLTQAVATVPATHRPAMAAVGEWIAQQRPLLWDAKTVGDVYYDAYDADNDFAFMYDTRETGPPSNAHGKNSLTAVGILLEDVIPSNERYMSLSKAEEERAEEGKWSPRKRDVFVAKKQVKAETRALKGKWPGLTNRDRFLYLAAVARFGEENVYLHQARQEEGGEPVYAAVKSLGHRLAKRPFDHVFMLTNTTVGPPIPWMTTLGTYSDDDNGVAGHLVYGRTVLCITLRRCFRRSTTMLNT